MCFLGLSWGSIFFVKWHCNFNILVIVLFKLHGTYIKKMKLYANGVSIHKKKRTKTTTH